ncbi:HNH endonuclease signature motif containing protein [Arthrobacter sp. UM1]|uniref:HNH endonuclease signature motif containing protein n=1 Tax=Arthrobacter sp. UM1 TaxID=2766776 RepID=UPI001CF610AB|nr:HNH endonuclease signature motif containing protein [Arthrobacter sp. UM1]MCB4208545.1 HNH endonuclease [Arthrobacter sp. UM1]
MKSSKLSDVQTGPVRHYPSEKVTVEREKIGGRDHTVVVDPHTHKKVDLGETAAHKEAAARAHAEKDSLSSTGRTEPETPRTQPQSSPGHRAQYAQFTEPRAKAGTATLERPAAHADTHPHGHGSTSTLERTSTGDSASHSSGPSHRAGSSGTSHGSGAHGEGIGHDRHNRPSDSSGPAGPAGHAEHHDSHGSAHNGDQQHGPEAGDGLGDGGAGHGGGSGTGHGGNNGSHGGKLPDRQMPDGSRNIFVRARAKWDALRQMEFRKKLDILNNEAQHSTKPLRFQTPDKRIITRSSDMDEFSQHVFQAENPRNALRSMNVPEEIQDKILSRIEDRAKARPDGIANESDYKSALQTELHNFDLDHKRELQLGGKDSMENMQWLHKTVNRSFGAQIRLERARGEFVVDDPSNPNQKGTRVNAVLQGPLR